jgi:thiaminase/transcriptional activator TenA
MVAELAWFEEKAKERSSSSSPPSTRRRGPTSTISWRPPRTYPVQLTALWALERAYLEAWRTALPGAPAYREFVEHWTNQAYAGWVGGLEAAADRALARGGDPEREAFRWIARYERDFWQMAYSGGDG